MANERLGKVSPVAAAYGPDGQGNRHIGIGQS